MNVDERVAVPFRVLRPVHEHVREQILADIAAILDAETFTNGPEVEAFERAFAAYCGTSACVGTSSGLDALRLSLLAAGVGPGDEVLVPANTFIATFEAVSQAGARPVIVDVGEADANIDVDAAAAAVGERTRCLLPVHLYGQMADMRALSELAGRHDLLLIEDACQAHGARRDGLIAGACGLAAGFSFWPGKNLGAIGDAGALVTSDLQLAERARAYREHGQTVKHRYDVDGYTARLDTIQAAVLLRKLPLLDGWNAERRAAARFYTERLRGVGDLRQPSVPEGSEPVWHLYLLRSGRRDALAAHLAERGIGTSLDARQPAHLSEAFRRLGYTRGSFPVTEQIGKESILLPLFPGIAEEQLEAVVDAVVEFFDGRPVRSRGADGFHVGEPTTGDDVLVQRWSGRVALSTRNETGGWTTVELGQKAARALGSELQRAARESEGAASSVDGMVEDIWPRPPREADVAAPGRAGDRRRVVRGEDEH